MTISYSLDGENYKEAGNMISVPGRWVGVKNGVFCMRKAPGEGGRLAVEYVEYEV